MILIHENLPKEAEKVAEALQSVYGINSKILNQNLDSVFEPITEFNGFLMSGDELDSYVSKNFPNQMVLAITPRDLYAERENQEDNWIFGYCHHAGRLLVATTARMKRKDNKPSSVIEVPEDRYLNRITSTAIHEIGHECIDAPHYKDAFWVNAKTGYKLHLGPHCTDNRCVMYEIVDINAPPAEEGHMLLGGEKKFDTGLDDVLARMHPDWFCDRCKSSIKVTEKYN